MSARPTRASSSPQASAAHWLDDGGEVVVRDLPTHYGKLSYTLGSASPDALRLTLDGDLSLPAGGIVVMPPLPGPLLQVEINGLPLDTFDAEGMVCSALPAEVVMRFRPQ